MDEAFLQWLGKEEKQTAFASPDHLTKLAALLEGQTAHWQTGFLPPLAHWIFCQPVAAQSKMDGDGHIQRGGFIPPIKLPRRMWASSEVSFVEPLPMGEQLQRLSVIDKIESKTNRKGEPLIFLTIQHCISGKTKGRVEEAQHLVYKSGEGAKKSTPPQPRTAEQNAQQTQEISFNAVQLFRFSALSFNAHLIHTDRDYAKSEGYPALVVHGPYLAFLLLNFYTAHKGAPKGFSFRAESPLFEGQSAKLCLAGNSLWIERSSDRAILMSGKVISARGATSLQ